MRKINNRGAMHIEIVISFVLFVSFVGFLLFYIKPYNTSQLPDSVVIGLHDNFVDVAKTNLTEIFIEVKDRSGTVGTASSGGSGLNIPTNGLVAYWSADGNANDVSGNGYNGVWSGISNYVSGKFGQAFSFSNSQSYVSSSVGVDLSGRSVSYGVWFKRSDFSDGIIFSHGTDAGMSFMGVRGSAPWCDMASGRDLIPVGVNIQDTNWHNLWCVFDNSNNNVSMYLDGNYVDSIDNLMSYSGNGKFWIDRTSWYPVGFNGLVDDLAIYNRKLSASEIKSVYNGGVA